ncbi:protein PIGMENT DEFECTIVE 338, chloroplastic [Cornus florida]|uniref:protein PIGMENT DEFECTIVE 338, chloroplastic n=1 Tax=Cornus florida TaxID=4283 RepID=UPI0028977936|nr:protein PIGMENT DEFECTIVE 338, chloroplastic [Cornus florida]
MPILLYPCNCFSLLNSSLPLSNFTTAHSTINYGSFIGSPKRPLSKNPVGYPKTLTLSSNSSIWRRTHVPFCSPNDVLDEFTSTHLPEKAENEGIQENEGLELMGKPSPMPTNNGSVTEVNVKPQTPDEEEVLRPFLKFFKPRDSLGQVSDSEETINEECSNGEETKKVLVEYYEPKPGDFVVGVVVSGNENKLDVNVGADFLGTMLTKEVLPLYEKEIDYLLCDMERDAEEFMVRGKMGIVRNDDAVNGEPEPGRPVVEPGTVLFAEVLGRTLSGRPLLSTRRFFRRVAWHRVRQIKQLNEPIEVKITEWNTGGLLTRIEGLRAFLPKAELMKRVNNFTDLKENVGRQLYVQISRINEATNDLILSEKEAWEMLHLQEGTLLEGTVWKIFPYGAQIRIGETNRSGLLHISKITRARVTSVSDLLAVDEKVQVLVVKSMFPDKIAFSIADLESEPGLFVSNKEKVFSEAEAMAKKYRQKLPAISATRKVEPLSTNALPFDDEANLFSNWKWFIFERDNELK